MHNLNKSFYSSGVPAVITMTAYIPDMTTDDVPFPEACRRLEEAGAAVVGVNCGRGPRTMLPLVKEIKKVCKVSKRTMIVHKRTKKKYRIKLHRIPFLDLTIAFWNASRLHNGKLLCIISGKKAIYFIAQKNTYSFKYVFASARLYFLKAFKINIKINFNILYLFISLATHFSPGYQVWRWQSNVIFFV